MAQKLIKWLKEKRPDLPKNNSLDDIPEKKLLDRPPKIIPKKKPIEIKIRNGNFQMGITPKERAKIIEDGRKIK